MLAQLQGTNEGEAWLWLHNQITSAIDLHQWLLAWWLAEGPEAHPLFAEVGEAVFK